MKLVNFEEFYKKLNAAFFLTMSISGRIGRSFPN